MRNQIAEQRHNLEVKAQADGLLFLSAAALKVIFCDESQPGNMLCYALNKVVDESAKDFAGSAGSLFLHDVLY